MPTSKNGHLDTSTPSGTQRRPPVDDSSKAQLETSPKILREAPPRSHSEPSPVGPQMHLSTPPAYQPALQQISPYHQANPYQQPAPYEQAHPNTTIINQGVREEEWYQKSCFCCCCSCPVWFACVLFFVQLIIEVGLSLFLYLRHIPADTFVTTTQRPYPFNSDYTGPDPSD